MPIRPYRRRRSVLYVPALNHKALAKLPALACDCVVIDLEDSIAPSRKAEARDAVKHFFETRVADGKEMVIRINALSSEWGADDLAMARQCRPDAILLPKVETARDVLDANDMLDELDARASLWLWAMVETPRAMLNLGAIAALGRDRSARLACLVAGTNDLVKDTGILATPDRRYLVPWLMQMVLAARAGDLDILDGVSNDFRDLDALGHECVEGRNMGFDGKTLIHPAQIDLANNAFSPAPAEVEDALAIRAAFALPDNADKGVISLGGKMVERLHLDQAERLLIKAGL
ncbi:HpcH/HpaI aldolase/citrate lyase family protein [Aerobium aerolatum]|uniref:Citrate lyase subunit beta / citryl-CoA lyase n=1 Tax=Aquamicrobium aerolatum DSM 21857 TaxID=1121003 RepID=A0A1I3IR07_9HYPH|nr:CoA ester lyase [Aquamicrobium aerolatum]SFI50425.1 citrate lyase subunit beta / citryl-CoA lyase [Aquamicrobium aerolatum DSM 21857]